VTQPHYARTIADLQPGDHICCLYETEEEHRAVLTPFLHQGLKRGEKVLYIVDAHTAEAVLGYLRNDGLDVEPYLTSGQLTIVTSQDAYMQQGVFDPDEMIAFLRAETERTLAEGYSALRVTGEMSWALGGLPGSERLMDYEAKLNEFFPGSDCLAMCQYDRRAFSPSLLLDVLCTHPIAVVGTEVYDNPYYVPPAGFLGDDPAAEVLRHWLEHLTERRRAEEAVRESEKRFRSLSGAAFEGLVIHERGKVLDANPAFARMFGYELSEVIGMHALDFTAPESRDLLRLSILSRREEPFEALGLRKDGSTLECELRGRDIPYQERIVTVTAVRDITERRRAEEALQEAREELESRVERRVQEVNGYGLTFRELTVLHLVATGKADKEIATVLGISPLTAHKHLANILDKMGAASRTEAGVRALRERLLDPQEGEHRVA